MSSDCASANARCGRSNSDASGWRPASGVCPGPRVSPHRRRRSSMSSANACVGAWRTALPARAIGSRPIRLRSRLMAAQGELATTRLQPALLTRALQERRDRLASIARLAEQLHPERPLQRGYAMVLDGTGKAVTSSAAARKEAALALKFRDGTLDVAPAASSRPPRSRTAPPSVSQPKLL